MSNPSPEALLEHVGFLRAVARGLLRNEADAEDVVQQTLVAAMEKPPPDDSNLKGWLAAVARNFARMQFRGRKRRRERETKVARSDAAPSADEIAARLEMEKRVVDAVASLEEPFRTMVILRYYDGLSPKRIAERLGIPAATVRTRLKRGLEKMRGDLEPRSGGRKQMLAGLLLLAQLPARAASPWPARLVAGGGVAALLVCVFTVAWLVREDRPEPARERAEVARGAAPDSGTAALVEPGTRPVATISGRVVDAYRRALAGAEVVALPHEGLGHLETPATRVRRFLARPEPVAWASSDAQGRYELALPNGGPVWIVARKEGYAIDAFPLLDPSGVYEQADLRIRASEGVGGTVVDGEGKPLGLVHVHGWDRRFSPDATHALETTVTDRLGRFRLPFDERVERRGRLVRNRITLLVDARRKGYLPRLLRDRPLPRQRIVLQRGSRAWLQTEPGARVYLFGRDRIAALFASSETVFWEDSPEWLTVFVDHPQRVPAVARWERNRPLEVPLTEAPSVEGETDWAGAEVGLRPPPEYFATAAFGFDCLRVVRAGADGRYALRGKGPRLFAHPDLSPILSPLDECRAAAKIEGRVLDGSGEPVPGARVTAVPHYGDGLRRRFARRQEGNWTAITRPDGTYVLPYLTQGGLDDFRLTAAHPGRGLESKYDYRGTTLHMKPAREPDVAPGSPATAPRPDDALEGVVVHNDVPVRDAEVAIEGRLGSDVRTNREGEFRIPVEGPGPYVVTVRKEHVGSGRFVRRKAGRLGTLQIPQWEPFSGRVLYGGAPIKRAYVRSFVLGRVLEETHTDPDGRFSLRCTPFDRRFSISISHEGFLTAWIENPAEGDVEMERAARVRLRVVDEAGRAVSGVEVTVDGRPRRTDLGGHIDVYRKSKDEMSIALEKAGQDWILAGPVEWSDDGALGIVRVRRGLRIEGVVRDAGNRPVPHVLVVAEPVAEGRPARRAFTNARGRFVLRTLHPERYRLRVAEESPGVIVEAGRTDVVLRKEKK